MSNILETFKTFISDDLIRTTSTSLGESEQSVKNAFEGIAPVIFSYLSDAKSEKYNAIENTIKESNSHSNMLSSITADIASQNNESTSLATGVNLMNTLFGNNSISIQNILSNFAGIKSSSSNAILTIASALVSYFLAKKMQGENLNFASLMNWITSSKSEFANNITGNFKTMIPSAGSTENGYHDESETKKNKWIFPLILLGLLLIGLFWWQKGCNQSTEDISPEDAAVIDSAGNSIDSAVNSAQANFDTNAVESVTGGRIDSAGNWVVTKGEAKTIKLDNGVIIETFANSLEDQLYMFIKDPGAIPDKDLWFNFDDLLFEKGKSTLKKGYEQQLNNTCEILKAYPTVKIKIGGYTDNTGDSLANVKLSTNRAKIVYEKMLQKEVTKASFDDKPYEGYGPQFPQDDNSTEEGRAKNRRIAISVRAK